MNNITTVEIDFSALHVILAYAEAGIDYWERMDSDPYVLPVPDVTNEEHARDIVKLLFLMAFNASDEQALFRAFRSELDYTKYPHSFPDKALSDLLATIKERHPDIAHLICSGAGLRLMNIDARICEYVIADFVSTATPILTIHDSFIVPVGSEERLNEVMREAFNQVTGKDHIKVKYNQNLTKKQLYAFKATDPQWFFNTFQFMVKGHRPTAGYQHRMQRHAERFNKSD